MSSCLSALQLPPFLRLPALIRNQIYRYALTSPTPLRYQPSVRASSKPESQTAWHAILYEARRTWTSTLSPNSGINQLKFVCKQLYAEIAGLELRFNSIVFAKTEQIGGKSADELFLDFIQTMAPGKISWLSTLTIESDARCLSSNQDKAPVMPRLTALVDVCKKHPSITMQYVFKNWSLESSDKYPSLNFITAGAALTVARRNDHEPMRVLITPSHVRHWPWRNTLATKSGIWQRTWRLRTLLEGVGNSAFFPAADLRDMERYMTREAEGLHVSEGWGLTALSYGTDWVRTGINAMI